MTIYYADLHIHSRYSRATSKNLSLRNLAAWAGIKGIQVLATGDFTHPGWFQEIEAELSQEESGLLRLKEPRDLDKEILWYQGESIPIETKFVLCTEISSIYKKDGQVRKIHNLVFMPSLEKARKFVTRLSEVGNLNSDGRPILGLDARDLLEMVLETDSEAYLIPAHIWTPWFSLFGYKSGFNSIKECFEDLSSEIFALETGLSSDPDMNWLWSSLDDLTLVSNSDAHSGEKLAREANIFSGELSYQAIFQALKERKKDNQFLGTIEFFPEEGKYHLDGHRKCGVVLDPREVQRLGNVCPVCGQPLTLGVLNRILSLADREQPKKPITHPDFCSLIPLPEILGETLKVGPRTKTVFKQYRRLLSQLGSELTILRDVSPDQIKPFSPLLAEGISRMRRKEVYRSPGFDGQYGIISLFTPEEKREFHQGKSLLPRKTNKPSPKDRQEKHRLSSKPERQNLESKDELSFNSEQKKAIETGSQPTLVIAGPGTGKTRTLIGRVEFLLKKEISPRRILIVTFTRAAARELQQRLSQTLGHKQTLPKTDTLHALGFEQWQDRFGNQPVILSEDEAQKMFSRANPEIPGQELKELWKKISLSREIKKQNQELEDYLKKYQLEKERWQVVDYSDLLESWLEQMEDRKSSNHYDYVLVDEVQDLSWLQLSLLKNLISKEGSGFFAIGDPEQSIYSFRGAVSQVDKSLQSFWPDLTIMNLEKNYRSKQNLLDFSAVIFPEKKGLIAQNSGQGKITFYKGLNQEQEASWMAETIKELIGGTGHYEADQNKTGILSPGDIAVLVRFKALIPALEKTFTKIGLPCTIPEETPFWQEPRIRIILSTVAKSWGIPSFDEDNALECPEEIMSKGPEAWEGYFQDVQPFDSLFWKSRSFQELKNAYQKHKGWRELLSWIQLESELSFVRQKAQKIRLMTMHAAKGLEFEAVFLPALEQGIMPFGGKEVLTGQEQKKEERPLEEEEKRLFYVSLTRAKSYLYLSYANKRKIYGQEYHFQPSAFLQLLPWQKVYKMKSVAYKVKQEKQLGLFQK